MSINIPVPTPLQKAAAGGDLDAMTKLLDDGAEVDEAPNNGFTPLARAAASGHADAVHLLISRGANVHASGGVGRHVLLLAAWHQAERGDKGIVQALLDAGADVNQTSCWGETALFGAASFPNGLATVRLLLAKGADVNIAWQAGWTPLMQAALDGTAEIVRELLLHKPDLDATNKEGQTALDLAVQYKRADVIKILAGAGAEAQNGQLTGEGAGQSNGSRR